MRKLVNTEGVRSLKHVLFAHRSEAFSPLDPGVQHFDLSKCLAGVAHKPVGCPRNPHVSAHFKPLLEEQERNKGSREEKGNLRSLGGHISIFKNERHAPQNLVKQSQSLFVEPGALQLPPHVLSRSHTHLVQ